MSGHGYAAMTLGIIFTLVVGCGLMALMFYSGRRGYDERVTDLSDNESTKNPPNRSPRYTIRRVGTSLRGCREYTTKGTITHPPTPHAGDHRVTR